ncbi:MAG: hypothetical protein FJ304_18060 [Planctomycetes bacterium]|nr:hypothetical protein [Planctomycetota bacterium]
MRWLTLIALGALAAFSALNWRAQLRTQQQLDSLNATLAERPNPAPAAPPPAAPTPEPGAVPRELSHVTLPPYVIEAPDLLKVEAAVKNATTGALDRLPVQALSGTFLVRPDGTIGLGWWGTADVAGLTTEQAAGAIRKQLTKFAAANDAAALPAGELVVTVDVATSNSKFYYVVTDFAGDGEQVARLPCFGNETVLDAVAQVGGAAEAAKRSVRVVRPRANGAGDEVLPVDWAAITQRGVTTTNYQIRTGDRVYVTASK